MNNLMKLRNNIFFCKLFSHIDYHRLAHKSILNDEKSNSKIFTHVYQFLIKCIYTLCSTQCEYAIEVYSKN